MTIRFTCAECSSVLKIKDELAGTSGKCPKCKTKFVVPAPSQDEEPTSAKAPDERPSTTPDHKASADSIPPAPAELPPPAVEETLAGDLATQDEIPVAASHSESDGKNAEPPPTDVFPVAAAAPGEEEILALPDDDEPASRPSAKTAEIFSSPTTVEEPLRLDDSNDDLDAIPLQKTSTEKPLSLDDSHDDLDAIAPVSLRKDDKPSRPVADDDDDLDSPSALVGSMMKAKPSNTDDSKSREAPKPPEKKPRSSKSSSEMEPFDPLKYLMNEPPKSDADFSTGPESDADLSLGEDSHADFDNPTPMPMSGGSSATNRPSSSSNRPSSAANRPSSASSRPTPEKVDLATAAKMMKKAIKDSQAEAAHQRELEAQAGFDYGQFFREFGMRGFALLAVIPLGVLICYLVGSYVVGGGLRLPKMGYVRGTVKLDGQPLVGAMIYYAPEQPAMEGTKRERARTSTATTDSNGYFKMMYLPEKRIEGVAVGKCRVWVEHIGPKGNDVPRKWMQAALVYKDVTSGTQNGDITMESDPVVKKK